MHTIRAFNDHGTGELGYEARTPAGALFYASASLNDLLQNMHNLGVTRAVFLDHGNPYILNFQPFAAGPLL